MVGLPEDDGPETFRPAPHQDDRLWRHPAEIAAEQARLNAAASTREVPAVSAAATPHESPSGIGGGDPIETPRPRMWVLATAAAVVGLGAMTIGVLSTNPTQAPDSTTLAAAAAGDPGIQPAVAADDASIGEAALADDIFSEAAPSLARVQTSSHGSMVEGNGLIVSPSGHLATSATLVADAEYVIVWLDDGTRWPAHVIASDEISGIAVIRIDRETDPARLGVDRPLRSGQYAMTANHAAATMALGEVSTFHLRSSDQGTTGATRFVVTGVDALPGSAVYDDSGAVIGITSDADQAGISTAVPAWLVERVAIDLITTGSTNHAWIGVEVDSAPSNTGAVVTQVAPGSPAAAAGVSVGDLISAVDDASIGDGATFWAHVSTKRPGEDAHLSVVRWGDTRTLVVPVGQLVD